MDDACVRDDKLSTHDDRSVEDSPVSEVPTTKVEEYSQMKKNITQSNTKQKMKISICRN